MTYEQLKQDPRYHHHHTSAIRGYASRNGKLPVKVLPYKGRFGEGYKVLLPRWDTTQYCWIAYYIRTEDTQR
jgi:hypothetical protein